MKGFIATLGWGCYLGSSWTWVIGMLLPILLLADHGPWGWVVFAVPNVLGAIAMGFVLSAQRSRAIVASHPVACAAFSRVTMAYQVLVLPWALVVLLGWPLQLAVGAIVVGYIVVLSFTGARPMFAAVVVSTVSLGLFGWFAFHEHAWIGVFNPPVIEPRLSSMNLWVLIPASMFGFLLCPYLDLTFHRARQEAGRSAFVIGFGIVFLAMIVFSLAYAGASAGGTLAKLPGGLLPGVIGGHLIIQSAFTVAVHLRELRRIEHCTFVRTVLPLGVFLLIGWLLFQSNPDPIARFDMDVSEMIYRVLLMFYGTIFPGYVLLMVIPTWRPVLRKKRLRLTMFAIGVSLPMAFITFIDARPLAILGIGAVFTLAWIVVQRLPADEKIS